MAKQILINSSPQETRIALLESGKVAELFFERNLDKGIVGNIYKGRVVRVLPGMQAAFIDIGHERAAFLYAGDFVSSKMASDEIDPDEDFEAHDSSGRRRRRSAEEIPPINELVKEGQEILVQVAKGPIGTKGARVTCHLSMPGRFLVFMPNLKHNGVSRKIESYEQRKKLKKLIDQYRNKDGGFIVRTAAASGGMISEKQIKSDVEYLSGLWQKIARKFKSSGSPKLLHYDLDLTSRVIRDQLDDEIDLLVVDQADEHRRILRFIRNFNPELKNKIELYQDQIPLFDRYNIESEIHKALGKRVWLKSGGYLIIEHTEALTSIDVNTGRFVGKKNLEETILRTNLEACEEIVRQLRLRNLGGIIILDFIDMEKDASKEQVYRYLDKLVREDKQKTTILKISNLGLVEMTRKRSRDPLHRYHTETCPVCDGRGFVKSAMTLAHQTLRDIRREMPYLDEDHLYVTVHPEVAKVLDGPERHSLVELEKAYQKGIRVKSDVAFHIEQIAISPSNAPKLKGASAISPLPILQKSSKAPDYAQDEDDQRDDSAEYQSDLQSIRANRESEAKLETPIIRENAAIETDEEDDSDLEVADESTTPDSENASSGTARDA
jgi:ribonuclease G